MQSLLKTTMKNSLTIKPPPWPTSLVILFFFIQVVESAHSQRAHIGQSYSSSFDIIGFNCVSWFLVGRFEIGYPRANKCDDVFVVTNNHYQFRRLCCARKKAGFSWPISWLCRSDASAIFKENLSVFNIAGSCVLLLQKMVLSKCQRLPIDIFSKLDSSIEKKGYYSLLMIPITIRKWIQLLNFHLQSLINQSTAFNMAFNCQNLRVKTSMRGQCVFGWVMQRWRITYMLVVI